MVGVAKKSKDKISIGGRKYALRRLTPAGIAEAEVIGIGEPAENDGDDRALLVPLVMTARWSAASHWRPLGSATPPPAPSSPERPTAPHGEPVIPTIHEGGYPS